ncbi:hypothetical protein ACFOWE_16595 [Planomonospora corallina]|uniref:Uncharacterized protein n=1 Tax=Planomonospora corallina TaxID=1806052 RepID=A0ABV8I982_9ACTN
MLGTPGRKTAAVALLVAALTGALGGCGGGDEEPETPDVVETGSPGVEDDGETDNDGDGD